MLQYLLLLRHTLWQYNNIPLNSTGVKSFVVLVLVLVLMLILMLMLMLTGSINIIVLAILLLTLTSLTAGAGSGSFDCFIGVIHANTSTSSGLNCQVSLKNAEIHNIYH